MNIDQQIRQKRVTHGIQVKTNKKCHVHFVSKVRNCLYHCFQHLNHNLKNIDDNYHL